MEKILLICNESKTVLNFRKELIYFLKENGFDVSVVVSDLEFVDKIKELGVAVYCTTHSNRSKNPFSILKLKKFYKRIIKENNPNIVFTFQLKPNVFGTLAARKLNVPIFNMVEGLGNPFMPRSFFDKIVRSIVSSLYRREFKFASKVFFLNRDDRYEFIRRKIIDYKKTYLINGIGIDTTKYIPNPNFKGNKRVIYLARLVVNKGIYEYCEIARKVRSQRKDIIFELYGSESELTKKDIQEYIDNGDITFGGYAENSSELISDSRVLASTSYREGFPRIILEAMALGRPVVGFDSIGTKDAILDNYTGYIVRNRSVDEFTDRLIEIIDDDELATRFGKNARDYCVKNYDSKIINGTILKVINRYKNQK